MAIEVPPPDVALGAFKVPLKPPTSGNAMVPQLAGSTVLDPVDAGTKRLPLQPAARTPHNASKAAMHDEDRRRFNDGSLPWCRRRLSLTY